MRNNMIGNWWAISGRNVCHFIIFIIHYSFTLFHVAFPFNWYARAIAALEFVARAAGRFDTQTPNFITSIF